MMLMRRVDAQGKVNILVNIIICRQDTRGYSQNVQHQERLHSRGGGAGGCGLVCERLERGQMNGG